MASQSSGAATAPTPVPERDLTLSGGAARQVNSTRAGFLPVSLDRVPLGALRGIPVHVRTRPEEHHAATPHAGFALYCSDSDRFAELHRRRLLERGVKFIYIRMTDQSRFRQQVESELADAPAGPDAASERSALIYETSIELVNELLAEPEKIVNTPRLEQICRATTTLVMNDPRAFNHLFAASHHDFYTATHMVNVATWMVPLAYEMGIRDPAELNIVGQAGMLHDIGKISIPESILNKTGELSAADRDCIRTHPKAGADYLARFDAMHPTVLRVVLEHHERMDGSGYPHGLTGDQMHPVSRICAVVDSFDAMTAFRPFKTRTLSPAQALDLLQKESPAKYDPDVIKAWIRLVGAAAADATIPLAPDPPPAPAGPASRSHPQRRRHQRSSFHCPGRAHPLTQARGTFQEQPGLAVVVHSISRGGLGFLSQAPIQTGEFVRVYVNAPGWESRPLEGQTVRCRAYNDSWHEIGLEFANLKAELTAATPAFAP